MKLHRVKHVAGYSGVDHFGPEIEAKVNRSLYYSRQEAECAIEAAIESYPADRTMPRFDVVESDVNYANAPYRR